VTSSCLAVLAVIWLRIRRPDAVRPFRVPGYPITPLIYAGMVIYMLSVMWDVRPDESLIGLGTLVVGAVIYLAAHHMAKQRPSPNGELGL
jgi:basic amino acid/polyamine antiporter, APA family